MRGGGMRGGRGEMEVGEVRGDERRRRWGSDVNEVDRMKG